MRGLGRGGLSSPRPHACGVLGGLRVELARPAAAGLARLGLRPDLCRSGLGQPRGPVPASGRSSGCRTARVKIGGVLRDVLPRSLALRASGGGARWNAVRGRIAASPTPPPIRAHPDTLRGRDSLTRVVQIRRNGGFPTPLVRPRLPGPFFVQNRSLRAAKGPRSLNFARKPAPEGAAWPPATHPEPFHYAKISGSLAFGGLPARRGLMIAPVTVPNAQSASGLGSGLAALRGYDLSILGFIFNSPRSKTSLRTQRPRFA